MEKIVRLNTSSLLWLFYNLKDPNGPIRHVIGRELEKMERTAELLKAI